MDLKGSCVTVLGDVQPRLSVEIAGSRPVTNRKTQDSDHSGRLGTTPRYCLVALLHRLLCLEGWVTGFVNWSFNHPTIACEGDRLRKTCWTFSKFLQLRLVNVLTRTWGPWGCRTVKIGKWKDLPQAVTSRESPKFVHPTIQNGSKSHKHSQKDQLDHIRELDAFDFSHNNVSVFSPQSCCVPNQSPPGRIADKAVDDHHPAPTNKPQWQYSLWMENSNVGNHYCTIRVDYLSKS